MPQIKKWKQEGNIYLWKYLENVKNYPGWHLTADPQGVASLLNLLECMERGDCSSQNSITITAPTPKVLGVPGNKGGRAKCESPAKFKIILKKEEADSEIWILEEVDRMPILTIGMSWLSDLKKGIKGISKGEGDYSIGHEMSKSESGWLWFWWYV